MSNAEALDGEKKYTSLDSEWAVQQKKSFTAWCNSHLKKSNMHIENIGEDFRSGLRLMKLLEVISGERLPKPEPDRMKLHKIANVNKALDFIQSKGVRLVSIGAEEIVDGNLKMTLGMIWTIILRFAIQNIEVGEMSAKDALLQWCKDNTKNYKNVKIENFQSSFKDGLAFCALIHNHSPALIDFDKLSKDDPLKNLNLAFNVAEQEFDIPKMLDADELANAEKPDDKSIMTYVSSYYHTFSDPKTLKRSKRQSEQIEEASKQISKAIQEVKDKALLAEYEQKVSSDILNWIKQKMEWMQKGKVKESREENHKKQAEFDQYVRVEKAEKLKQVAQFDEQYKSLKERLSSGGQELQTVTPTEIAKEWNGLESVEKEYEKWLEAERKRLSRVDFLLRRFRKKCKSQEEWNDCKNDAMHSEDFKKCSRLSEAKALMKRHEAFEAHMHDNEARLQQIAAIQRELAELGYEYASSLQLDADALREKKKSLVKLAEIRKENIKKTMERMEQSDNLSLIYSSRAAKLNHRLIDEIEDLEDLFMANSANEVKAMIETNQRASSRFNDYKNELNEIEEIGRRARKLVEENGGDATNVCALGETQKVRNKLEKIDDLWALRSENLANELESRETSEKALEVFLLQKALVISWIDSKLDEIKTLVNSTENAEQTIDKIKSIDTEKLSFQEKIDEIERLAAAFEEDKEIKEVRNAWQKLDLALCRCYIKLQHLIQASSAPNYADLLKEFRSSFNPIDKYPASKQSYDSHKQNSTRVNSKPTTAESNDHLRNAFRILAKNKDYILRSELPANEADECIRRMKPYEGADAPKDAYDYSTFTLQ